MFRLLPILTRTISLGRTHTLFWTTLFRPHSEFFSTFSDKRYYHSSDFSIFSQVNHFDETAYIESKKKDIPQLFSSQLTSHQLDQVPTHPIPKLPVLNGMVQKIKPNLDRRILKETAIIGAQHILETTSSLFKAFIDTGIPPKNIWMIGKIYSTSLPVAKAARQLGIHLMEDAMPTTPDGYNKANRTAIINMWRLLREFTKSHDIRQIIVVDDGGRVIELVPQDFRLEVMMAAVEQTRGGLYSREVNSLLYPLIPVASSAIKKHFLEPLMIAKALFRAEKAIASLDIDSSKACGIIGNGAIGRALADYLIKKGFKVIAYDSNPEAFKGLPNLGLVKVNTIEMVIANASFIFGCTGQDITKDIDIFSLSNTNKIFISTTSEQNEFLSLIRFMSKIFYRDQNHETVTFNPLGDLVCTNECRSITVKNMGYPFNFPIIDNYGSWIQPWNVPARDIELTQCAMYGGTIQALVSASKPTKDSTINNIKIHCLDPFIQRYIAQLWGKREYHRFAKDYPKSQFTLFESIDWIQKNSGGKYYPSLLSDCFREIPTPTSFIPIKEYKSNVLQPT